MNTKQLIALWYVGFAFLVALWAYFPENEYRPLTVSLVAITILAVLLIFTFKESKLINRKKVMYNGILPIGLIAGLLLVYLFIEQNNYQYNSSNRKLSSSKVEVFDLKFKIEKGQLGRRAILSGRVKNNAESDLNKLIIGIQIYKLKNQGNNKTMTFEEFLQAEPISKIHKDSLADSLKKDVGRVIDSETFYWDAYVRPSQVESFEIESYPSSLRPTDHWVWSYQLKSARSGY